MGQLDLGAPPLHHAGKCDDIEETDQRDPAAALSRAYDMVLNGTEAGRRLAAYPQHDEMQSGRVRHPRHHRRGGRKSSASCWMR
jgi:hypothetical protein